MPLFFQQDIDDTTRLAIWKIEEEEDFFHVPLQREITHPHKRLQHLAGRYLLKYLFPDFPTELIRIADTRKPFLEDEKYHFSISHCGDYAAVIVSSRSRVGIDVEVISDKPFRIMHKFLSLEEISIVQPNLHDKIGQSETPNVNHEMPSTHENSAGSFINTELASGIYVYEGETGKKSDAQTQHQSSNFPDHSSDTKGGQPQTSKNLSSRGEAEGPSSQLLTLCWSAKEAMFKWWGLGKVDFSEMLHLSGMNESEEGVIDGRFVKESFDIKFPVHYKMFDGIVMAWVKTDPGVFDKQ